MKRQSVSMGIILVSFITLPIIVKAEPSNEAWKKEMERKIEILTREVEKKQLGQVVTKIQDSKYGLGPAASKVYHVDRGVSIGGYGEMIYNNFESKADDGTPSGKKDQIDFLRAILYVGYKYSDQLIFNSEIEFEHASTSNGGSRGEVSVELASLDYIFHSVLGARAGLLLVPVGIRNELHEPNLFHGTARPSTEQRIIPTTWRENGGGFFGNAGGFEYRSYIMAGLQGVASADGFGGFGSNGIRGGRSKGAKSLAEDLAWVGRIDYNGVPGARIGGSYYTGGSGQGSVDANGNEIDGKVNMWELHAEAEYWGAEFTGLYVKQTIDDVAGLNFANGLTGNQSIGEKAFGGYLQFAYNFFSLIEGCDHYLASFYRFDRYNTQQQVPTGFTTNSARDRTEHVYGLTYKPHSNVVVKFDVVNENNKAGTGVDSANLGMGYAF